MARSHDSAVFALVIAFGLDSAVAISSFFLYATRDKLAKCSKIRYYLCVSTNISHLWKRNFTIVIKLKVSINESSYDNSRSVSSVWYFSRNYSTL